MYCSYFSFIIIAILSGVQIYFQSMSFEQLQADKEEQSNPNAYSEKIALYCYFVFALTLCSFARSIILAFLSRRMSVTLHFNIIFRLLRGSFPKFFNVVTNGRLINRLSSDIYTVDSDLPYTIDLFTTAFFSFFATLLMFVIMKTWIF